MTGSGTILDQERPRGRALSEAAGHRRNHSSGGSLRLTLPVSLVSVVLLTATSGFSIAHSQVATSSQATPVPPQSSLTPDDQQPYQIDTGRSRVYTFVGKTGFGHDHGVEGRIKSGFLRPGATENAGLLVFDMLSFDADTNAARRFVGLSGSTDASTRQQVNANMRGQAILDVRRYPTATFKVDSAIAMKRNSRRNLPLYTLTGQFTLHGVTRPLKVVAEVSESKSAYHITGNFAILQTQFGITPFSKAFGAVGVADQLKIFGDLYVAR